MVYKKTKFDSIVIVADDRTDCDTDFLVEKLIELRSMSSKMAIVSSIGTQGGILAMEASKELRATFINIPLTLSGEDKFNDMAEEYVSVAMSLATEETKLICLAEGEKTDPIHTAIVNKCKDTFYMVTF